MFYILAVILIAIGGILFILIFDDKPKTPQPPKTDNRATRLDQNSIQNEEVTIVFDEPLEIQQININLNPSGDLGPPNQNDEIQDAETLHPEPDPALTTNSKINPFNF